MSRTKINNFRVFRDVVYNNMIVTDKLYLTRGAQACLERSYATASVISDAAVVNTAYTGLLYLTVSGSSASSVITINNPFIDGVDYAPVFVEGPVGSTPTITVDGPGLATLTLGGIVTDGIYAVTIGCLNI